MKQSAKAIGQLETLKDFLAFLDEELQAQADNFESIAMDRPVEDGTRARDLGRADGLHDARRTMRRVRRAIRARLNR